MVKIAGMENPPKLFFAGSDALTMITPAIEAWLQATRVDVGIVGQARSSLGEALQLHHFVQFERSKDETPYGGNCVALCDGRIVRPDGQDNAHTKIGGASANVDA
jgi:hypothetical protein